MTKNDGQNRGIDEAVSIGRGAYKAARLAEAASKGAAAGGIWGAAASVAWEGREHIGKLIAAAAVLLMLPVLFILMLPALIFGGLTTSRADGAAQPVLNDAAAVTQNITDTTYAINQVLGEGIDDVTARIAAHFAETDGDNYEIVNPYEGNLVSNANIFLGEYCAAKDTDWQSISKDDLERILRDGKDQLYGIRNVAPKRTVRVCETGGEYGGDNVAKLRQDSGDRIDRKLVWRSAYRLKAGTHSLGTPSESEVKLFGGYSCLLP